MSLDSSLKAKSGLKRARNVLKRHERIEQLKEEDRWNDEMTALGLPKVRIVKTTIGKKKKVKKKEDDS